jgi:hypothetical protein
MKYVFILFVILLNLTLISSLEIIGTPNIQGVSIEIPSPTTTSGGSVLNVTNLTQLDDVTISSPQDDQVLSYNAAGTNWINKFMNGVLSFSNNYLFFSGNNEISFNETKLNATIDARSGGGGGGGTGCNVFDPTNPSSTGCLNYTKSVNSTTVLMRVAI